MAFFILYVHLTAGSANGEIGYGQSYDETYGGETKEH